MITEIFYRLARPIAHLAATVIAAMPRSEALLQSAALLPPRFKSPSLVRAMRLIDERRRSAQSLIATNFGISPDLRIDVPTKKYDIVFGRPDRQGGERSTLRLASLLAAKSSAFLDVGSHEGLYAFTIAHAFGKSRSADIHVFEPDPSLFVRLAANLARNNVDIRKNCCAAGYTTGIATFYRNITDDLSGSLNPDFAPTHAKQAVDVPVVRLADYLESAAISHACIKVDVEGFGAAVWGGLLPALARVDWLIFEIVGPEWDAGLPERIVRESGWHAYYIRDFELRHWAGGAYDYLPSFYNWLFCPHSPEELVELLSSQPFSIVPTDRKQSDT